MPLSVRAAKSDHLPWLIERAGLAVTSGFRGIEAVTEDGKILGMVGYDCWTPAAVEMHFAFDAPIAIRALLRPAFEYPFVEAKRQMVLGLTPSHKGTILGWRERFGFKEIGRIKDGWAHNDDIVISVLRKEDCRWIREGQ